LRKIYVTEPGAGYNISAGCAPAVSFFGGLGSMTTYDTQKPTSVAFILMNSLGTGYVQATTFVAITGGGGGGAGATPVVSGGQVVMILMTNGGQGYTSPPNVTIYGAGTAATASAVLAGSTNTLLNIVRPPVAHAVIAGDGTLSSIVLDEGGAGYTSLPTVTISGNKGGQAEASGIETHAVPFLRNPSAIAVQTAMAAVPWWRGRITLNNIKVYDDSLLIIRPSLIANASLALAGTWQGAMNPVNDFVTSLLSFRRSVVMDLQIFGSGRLLYQGSFAVMSVIPTT
jgi:hypothetical protein